MFRFGALLTPCLLLIGGCADGSIETGAATATVAVKDPVAEFEKLVDTIASRPQKRYYVAEKDGFWSLHECSVIGLKSDVKKTDSLKDPIIGEITYYFSRNVYHPEPNAKSEQEATQLLRRVVTEPHEPVYLLDVRLKNRFQFRDGSRSFEEIPFGMDRLARYAWDGSAWQSREGWHSDYPITEHPADVMKASRFSEIKAAGARPIGESK